MISHADAKVLGRHETQVPIAVMWSTTAVTFPFASTVVCTTARAVQSGAFPWPTAFQQVRLGHDSRRLG
jgi:hypothetical protein